MDAVIRPPVHGEGKCPTILNRRKSGLLARTLYFFAALITFPLFTLTTFAAQNSLTDTQLLQIKYDQKPGSQVSPNLVFRDETGKQVRLGDYFGTRPIVLVPGYYRCPMLCSFIMEGLIESFRDLKWNAGEQFDVVFVSIDPKEDPALAAAKKKLYLRDYGRAGTENGWHFLVAATNQFGALVGRSQVELPPPSPGAHDNKAIDTLADEIGFRFAYDAASKQYAHPAGFVVLTPDGKVAHYFFGVTFSAKEVDAALRHANARKTDSPVRDFILLCCEYSPLRGKYGNLVMDVVRAGGFGMVAALGIYFIRPMRRKPAPNDP
ncbi:MAG TPA: SCO family protein [Verrucomicrobiae bacterium]|nr:SCO family protein [Verrucomicrobiae bacterium]